MKFSKLLFKLILIKLGINICGKNTNLNSYNNLEIDEIFHF